MSAGPHAPWWVPPEGNTASPIQTGQIAGVLHARRVDHPWLHRATDVMWRMIDRFAGPAGDETSGLHGGYEMFGVLAFLQRVPDRARPPRRYAGWGRCCCTGSWWNSTRTRPGRCTLRWNFAPLPDSVLRPLFGDAVIDAHRDHLAAAQLGGGGWTFNWPSWSPAAEADWRGFLTVDALRVLRANGRG